MKILHLDDHQLFSEGFTSALTQHGLDVVSVVDVPAAIRLLDEQAGFDLVIADLSLPGIDGITFLKSLIHRELLLPVLVLSASEDIWLIKKSLEAGAVGFIPKTYSVDQLVQAIKLVEKGEMYLPEKLQQQLAQLPETEPCDPLLKKLSIYKLSKRQLEVLQLMQKGCSNDEISIILHVSKNTIKTHVKNLFGAFNAKSRIECVRSAEKANIL